MRARGCTGERIAPSRGLDIAVDRGRTACAAAIGRICCPVARATLATGGPKLPLRETVAFGPVRGRVCVTTPYVRRDGIATDAIGRVKCVSVTATQAGWRYPNAIPGGPRGHQLTNPPPYRQETQAGAQTLPGIQYQPTPTAQFHRP